VFRQPGPEFPQSEGRKGRTQTAVLDSTDSLLVLLTLLCKPRDNCGPVHLSFSPQTIQSACPEKSNEAV
jgi:hypothetical protein